MHDVVEFLREHPPFDDLSERELEMLARSVEVEYFSAGTTIFRQGEGPMEHARVVRRGAVELVDRGNVLDLLGEGELFGHPSMLSGQPTGFEARAAEDMLCYRLPAQRVVELLSRPAGLRFVARNLLARPKPDPGSLPANLDPGRQPVAQLVRGEPAICEPETSLREGARLMSGDGRDSVLVRLGEGEFGILTNSDLREVVAEGMPVDSPVSKVMSSPAYSVTPDRLGGEVMLDMLKRGIRHVPVISPLGDVVGVLSDVDLLAAQTQTPFALRREIDDAADTGELNAVAARLPPAVVSMHDARVAPQQISSIISIVVDALTRRLIELTIDEIGAPPCPLEWLAMGSHGRSEAMPSSDVDSALVWHGEDTDEENKRYASELAGRVVEQLAAAGFAADSHGASAAQPLFEHSADAWRHTIRHCIADPGDKGLVLISLLVDSRAIYGAGDAREVLDEFRAAHGRRGLLNLMLRLALFHKPPSGFLREFIVEHSGEHRGQLDIKHGGVLPVTSIARYASLAAGAQVTSTPERLRIAGTAGKLEGNRARTLLEAFDLFTGLRLEHQVEQIRRGEEPDDYIDPEQLNPLTRRYLRDAFGAVRSVQKELSKELSGEATFG